MKAIVCEQWGGPELLALREVPLPEPGPGQVRVRVAAAGVNFPDVLIIQKKYRCSRRCRSRPAPRACARR